MSEYEYIPNELRKRFEKDREQNFKTWLEINAEIADGHCCRTLRDEYDTYAKLIYAMQFPSENDKETLQAADYNEDGYQPILLRGVIIDNALLEDGARGLCLIGIEDLRDGSERELLHIRECACVYYTLFATNIYADRQYTIGDLELLRPGKRVVIALTNLELYSEEEKTVIAQYTDIAEDRNSEYIFCDDAYKIHQSEKEYLLRYNELAEKRSGIAQSQNPSRKNEFDTNISHGGEHDTDNCESSEESRKPGCLGRVVMTVVVLYIICLILSECGGNTDSGINKKIERSDGASAETGQTQGNELNDNNRLYNICIRAAEKNIEELVAQEPLDAKALEEEFEFLLTCYASEYMFKSMAYGHFTGEYEPTQYDYIAEKSNEVAEQMKKYMDEETVNELCTAVSLQAYQSFDDAMFDYDSCLIGTTQAPDIDAMWYEFFDILAEDS